MADVYDRLGVRKIYSCFGTVTVYGGSLMAPEVLDAMKEASCTHVVIPELLEKAGQRVAELIGVEAAYISSGAAGGLVLATAACVAGEDVAKIRQLPDTTGMKNEVIVHRCQRNWFDQAVRQVGVKFVEIGMAGTTQAWELQAAISENTAAVFYVPAIDDAASIPFPEVVQIAHSRGIPIIVDHAAEIPPISNLHLCYDLGADLVVFSGGKGLRGPQSTGLILGRKDLIKACAANGNPHHSIGRPMKVGKEEIVGMVTALELYLGKISKEEQILWDKMLTHIQNSIEDIPGIRVWRKPKLKPTRDVPILVVELEEAFRKPLDQVVRELNTGDPGIYVPTRSDGFSINPHTLLGGSEIPIAHRLREVLAG